MTVQVALLDHLQEGQAGLRDVGQAAASRDEEEQTGGGEFCQTVVAGGR